jgi:hypothetical protein
MRIVLTFLLGISGFGVDLPNVFFLEGRRIDHALDGIHRRQHRVIHVVVTMLTIPADAIEVRDRVEVDWTTAMSL